MAGLQGANASVVVQAFLASSVSVVELIDQLLPEIDPFRTWHSRLRLAQLRAGEGDLARHVLFTNHLGQEGPPGEDMDRGTLGQEAQQGANLPDQH